MKNDDNVQTDFILPSPLQKVEPDLAKEKGIQLYIKRDDLIHPEVSGNKWRKLKYNIQEAQKQSCDTLLTFGGAYSNHILATAVAGQQFGQKTIGIIRGEEHMPLNPTLQQAAEYGMKLEYIDRSAYREKNDSTFLNQLQDKYPTAFIIPEGGDNEYGIRGCEDIYSEIKNEIDFDYLTVDCGTGATLAGLINASDKEQIIGIPVLKAQGYFEEYISEHCPNKNNYKIYHDYHFGGYAKWKPELLEFMRWFYNETGIKTDPIYTGKQAHALVDLIKKDTFLKGSTVVFLHTGGLQGIDGFEERFNLSLF